MAASLREAKSTVSRAVPFYKHADPELKKNNLYSGGWRSQGSQGLRSMTESVIKVVIVANLHCGLLELSLMI